MRVKAVWVVSLPFIFKWEEDLGTDLKYKIEEVNIKLIERDKVINKAEITLYHEYEGGYLGDFDDEISLRAGRAFQLFMDGYFHSTNGIFYQIFDGEDFLIPYTLKTIPNLYAAKESQNTKIFHLNNDILSKSVVFANKEKDVFDNAWYLICDAENNVDLGKYDIALLVMAITLEYMIKSLLGHDLLNSDGSFREVYKQELEVQYGERRISFSDRYYRYGLSKLSKCLEEGLLKDIDFIFKVRNKLAHGVQLFDISLLIEKSINQYNIRMCLEDLIDSVRIIYNTLKT